MNKKTGKIRVEARVRGAGRRPHGLARRCSRTRWMGNLIMGTSRTLLRGGRVQHEARDEPRLGDAIRSCASRITRTSRTRSSQRLDLPPTGAGEPPDAADRRPRSPNAFFDATGVRIRQAPMTPAQVARRAQGSRREVAASVPTSRRLGPATGPSLDPLPRADDRLEVGQPEVVPGAAALRFASTRIGRPGSPRLETTRAASAKSSSRV